MLGRVDADGMAGVVIALGPVAVRLARDEATSLAAALAGGRGGDDHLLGHRLEQAVAAGAPLALDERAARAIYRALALPFGRAPWMTDGLDRLYHAIRDALREGGLPSTSVDLPGPGDRVGPPLRRP